MSHPVSRLATTAALTIAATMLAVPVAAQDDPAELEAGVLGELLPSEVSGIPLDPLELPFELVLEGADPDNPDDVAAVEAFAAFVESQGLAVEDFVLGNASAIDFDAGTGVLVAGARTTDPEVTPDLEAFVQLLLAVDPSLTSGDSDMSVEPGQVDGRDVLLVAMEVLQDGEFNESDHVGITAGGYALLLQGDPDPIREILAALPAEAEVDEEADADAEAEESDESEEG